MCGAVLLLLSSLQGPPCRISVFLHHPPENKLNTFCVSMISGGCDVSSYILGPGRLTATCNFTTGYCTAFIFVAVLCFCRSTSSHIRSWHTDVSSAQQHLHWHRTTVFVTCLVITALSCWALSKQDLFAHDVLPHHLRYVWLQSAVLSMLSWKELCVTCCLPRSCFLLQLWENHWDQRWLRSSKKLVQQQQCKVSAGRNSSSIPPTSRYHLVKVLARSQRLSAADYSSAEQVDIAKVLGVATVNWRL